MDSISTRGFGLVITTAVFGLLAALAGLIYACIYCRRIRPRKGNAMEGDYPAGRLEAGCDQSGEKSAIKMHPLFALSKIGRLRDNTSNFVGSYNN